MRDDNNNKGDSAALELPAPGRSDMAGVACSSLGLAGWIGVVPFLDRCEQGEQLARYFAALFNVILLAAIGGTATVLLLVGLGLSRRAMRRGDESNSRLARRIALGGLAAGAVVVVYSLPRALRILN